MSAEITQEERDAINAAIAAGKVTVVPTGATTETRYIWDGKELVRADGINSSWREQRRVSARNWNERRQSAIIARAERRRDQVAELAASGLSRKEISQALNVHIETIKKDCQIRGIKTAPTVQAKRDNPVTRAVIEGHRQNPHLSHAKLARLIQVSAGTVRRVRFDLRSAG